MNMPRYAEHAPTDALPKEARYRYGKALKTAIVGRFYDPGKAVERPPMMMDPVESVENTEQFMRDFVVSVRQVVSKQVNSSGYQIPETRVKLVNSWLDLALNDEQVVTAFQQRDLEKVIRLIDDSMLQRAIQFAIHDQTHRTTQLTPAELDVLITQTKARLVVSTFDNRKRKFDSSPRLAALVAATILAILLNLSSPSANAIASGNMGQKDAPTSGGNPTPTPTPDGVALPSPTLAKKPDIVLSTPTPEYAKATAQLLVISGANLRTGPGTTFPIVGSASAGDILDMIGKNENGSWFEVQTKDDQDVWIFADLVEPIASVEVATQELPNPSVSTPDITASSDLIITRAVPITDLARETSMDKTTHVIDQVEIAETLTFVEVQTNYSEAVNFMKKRPDLFNQFLSPDNQLKPENIESYLFFIKDGNLNVLIGSERFFYNSDNIDSQLHTWHLVQRSVSVDGFTISIAVTSNVNVSGQPSGTGLNVDAQRSSELALWYGDVINGDSRIVGILENSPDNLRNYVPPEWIDAYLGNQNSDLFQQALQWFKDYKLITLPGEPFSEAVSSKDRMRAWSKLLNIIEPRFKSITVCVGRVADRNGYYSQSGVGAASGILPSQYYSLSTDGDLTIFVYPPNGSSDNIMHSIIEGVAGAMIEEFGEEALPEAERYIVDGSTTKMPSLVGLEQLTHVLSPDGIFPAFVFASVN